MAGTVDLLFVYGTLRAQAQCAMGREPRERLASEGVAAGAAAMVGRLYDLGGYPGMAAAEMPDERVVGELLRLADPDQTFGWLDIYEEVDEDGQVDATYARRICTVVQPDGSEIQAWTYVWVGPVAGRPLIASGDWLAWLGEGEANDRGS